MIKKENENIERQLEHLNDTGYLINQGELLFLNNNFSSSDVSEIKLKFQKEHLQKNIDELILDLVSNYSILFLQLKEFYLIQIDINSFTKDLINYNYPLIDEILNLYLKFFNNDEKGKLLQQKATNAINYVNYKKDLFFNFIIKFEKYLLDMESKLYQLI